MHVEQELFSFHLLSLPLTKTPGFLLRPVKERPSGLRHVESFFTMKLGESIAPGPRYDFHKVAVFAWWDGASSLESFLRNPRSQAFSDGWHVRLKLYRRWGRITEIANAVVDASLATPDRPVVAVTLARLKLSQTIRFTRWGKPVERQVRDHAGKTLALAAMRPPGTFCTFSIWKNEAEMIGMVLGRDGDHRAAMHERVRKDFHHEFTTMRFVPIGEFGTWDGRAGYV